MAGKVKWLSPEKGYGFIEADGGGKDVFVHASAVEAAGMVRLNDGQRVSFDVATDRGRTAAGNLKLG